MYSMKDMHMNTWKINSRESKREIYDMTTKDQMSRVCEDVAGTDTRALFYASAAGSGRKVAHRAAMASGVVQNLAQQVLKTTLPRWASMR